MYMSGMTLAMKLLVISLILIHCIPLHSLSHEAAADPLQITVDAVKGHDNSSCSTNQIPCATLSYASKVLQKQQQERNILYIKRGEYNLTVRIEMSRRTSIEIIGLSTSQQVQIICSNNVGLAFAYMKNVSISNITLLGCGIQKVSSSVNTTDKQFLNYFVSLYIINCATINISHVHVNNSIGTGVTIYNPNTVQVTGSVIANSLLHGYLQHEFGGTGLQVEFTYCGTLQDDSATECLINYQYEKSVEITDTKFINNTAYQDNFMSYKVPNMNHSNFAFGRGGGLSIIFKGITFNNRILLNKVDIIQNYGCYGGGFYIGFHGSATANIVNFTNVKVIKNENLVGKKWNTDESGGGGKIMYASPYLHNNTIIFDNCSFHGNNGQTGGGLSLELAIETKTAYNKNLTNHAIIKKSRFTNNAAFLGSAMYFSRPFFSSCDTECFTLLLEDLNITNNFLACSSDTFKKGYFVSLPCSGILYSSNIPFQIIGQFIFERNSGSALELHFSYVQINSRAVVSFKNNIGKNGGAIALLDCSYILLYNDTNLNFTENKASEYGGAVYSGVCTSNNQPTTLSSKCFLQYYQSIHPENWETNLYFENNQASGNTSSIHAVNAISCWWQSEDNSLNTTFCWTCLTYRRPDSCRDHISSAPAYVRINNPSLHGRPGEIINLPVTVYDGTGDISDSVSLKVCVLEEDCASLHANFFKKCATSENNSFSIYYHSDSSSCANNVSLTVDTRGSSTPLQFDLNFNFDKCEWPFENKNGTQCSLKQEYFCCSSSKKQTCRCNNSVNCDFNSLLHGAITVKNRLDYCLALDGNKYVSGLCPYFFYNYLCSFYKEDNSNSIGHCASNRTGVLCGNCLSDHYAVPINSIYLSCMDCSDDNWGFIKFLLLQILPETIMVVLILIFNMKITNGTINGYIFYSQIISLSIPGWYYPAWIANFWDYDGHYFERSANIHRLSTAYIPFSMWNFNFLVAVPPSLLKICLTKTLGTLGAISFWYLISLYPLVLLLLLFVWLVMYNEGYRIVVKITCPVHKMLARFWQAFKIEPALTDSVAIIYIMCFTQFTATSLNLLHFATVFDVYNDSSTERVFFYNGTMKYFGWPHAIPGMFAIVVLVFMVALPILFLLFYQFRSFQWLLSCLHLRKEWLVALGDVITGSFRNSTKKFNDHRYFAGLFLLLRVAIICIYFMPYKLAHVVSYMQLVFMVLSAGVIMVIRPYTENIHNFTNFLLLLLLAIISGLTYVNNEDFNIILDILVSLIHIPFLFACGYFLFWAVKKILLLCMINKKTISIRRIPVYDKDDEDDDDDCPLGSSMGFPDRILNPDGYEPVVPGLNTSSDNYGSIIQQANIET